MAAGTRRRVIGRADVYLNGQLRWHRATVRVRSGDLKVDVPGEMGPALVLTDPTQVALEKIGPENHRTFSGTDPDGNEVFLVVVTDCGCGKRR